AIFVRILLYNSLLLVPGFIALCISFSIWSASIFVVGVLAAAARVETLDHTNIHNHLFAHAHLRGRERLVVGTLDLYQAWILNPVCLRMPNWYRVQHVVVHHAEDNGVEDTQSTLPYDRTSYLDFARSAFRVALSMCFAVDVLRYLARHRRRAAIASLARGMI